MAAAVGIGDAADMDAEQTVERAKVKPLTEVCIETLIQYKRFLGDVGDVELAHLCRILAHCTRSELESIEDLTWEGSSHRDLTWWTWHLWYRIYVDNYGQPDPEQLLPLPGQPPKDYAPPTGLNYTPANYRGMIQKREEELAARRAAAANRLRANYKAENKKRLDRGVEYTTKLPPPKRAKVASPAAQLQKQLAAANASRTLAGKPAGKVMKDLGLAKLGKPASGGSSRLGQASQQRNRLLGQGGRQAAAAAAAQPSALACLARKKPAAPPAAGAAKAGAQNQQQQRKFSIGSIGSAGVQRPQGGIAAAAGSPRHQASPVAAKLQQPQRQQLQQQQARVQGQQQRQQQQGGSSFGLLDTPVKLQSGKQEAPSKH